MLKCLFVYQIAAEKLAPYDQRSLQILSLFFCCNKTMCLRSAKFCMPGNGLNCRVSKSVIPQNIDKIDQP